MALATTTFAALLLTDESCSISGRTPAFPWEAPLRGSSNVKAYLSTEQSASQEEPRIHGTNGLQIGPSGVEAPSRQGSQEVNGIGRVEVTIAVRPVQPGFATWNDRSTNDSRSLLE